MDTDVEGFPQGWYRCWGTPTGMDTDVGVGMGINLCRHGWRWGQSFIETGGYADKPLWDEWGWGWLSALVQFSMQEMKEVLVMTSQITIHHQHIKTQFIYRPDVLPVSQPTSSVKSLNSVHCPVSDNYQLRQHLCRSVITSTEVLQSVQVMSPLPYHSPPALHQSHSQVHTHWYTYTTDTRCILMLTYWTAW